VLPAEQAQKLAALDGAIARAGLDALLVSYLPNIRYLTGFTGSLALALVGPQLRCLLGDSRYWVQMADECPAFELVRVTSSGGIWPLAAETLRQRGLRNVGVESTAITLQQHQGLTQEVGTSVELVPVSGLVEAQRIIKTPTEIEYLRQAARRSSAAFDETAAAIRPGMREREVAWMLEQAFHRHGGEGLSFPPIVGAGERGALPHARASDRVIERGELVVMDFGTTYRGYPGDITRSFVVAESPNAKQEKVLALVQAAQQASLKAMRPGVGAAEVDRIARDIVRDGIGPEGTFGHGLGHGIGLEVHEIPYLRASDSTPLAAGMVTSNEPGVYLAGWGGVRLEEMVLITENGPEVLSPASHRRSWGAP
jgi:Xaa-Pro aminopeptidase